MRRQRVKEIIEKANDEIQKGLVNPETMVPGKDQEDNGRFISKYFDTVSNKQCQQYFCQYNQTMFAKLIYQMRVKELSKGQFLYQKGDQAKEFYFVLKGKLELVVDSAESQEFKFSKNIDEYEFFGMKQSIMDTRHDWCRAVADKVWVMEISKEKYEQIIKKTQLSASEQKIDFLVRYVPKLRSVARSMMEEFEVFFIKEVVTQGYQIQRQDEQDDYLYFIYKGKCRMLLSTSTMDHNRAVFPEEISNDKNRKNLVIGQLKRGDCFGEHSALNDLPNPYTVEAVTQEVELYKILRGHLIQYFGGLSGEPVTQLRAQILLKSNWLKMKMDYLRQFSKEQLLGLEYRNEEEHQKFRPTKTNPKEVSYIKNNPREKELNPQEDGGEDYAKKMQDAVKTQRQRQIDELKKSLLAPLPAAKPQGGQQQQQQPVVASMGMNKIDRGGAGEADKFNKVMDWGTPRLVTKNRALIMDQKQVQQRAFLQNIASVRKGIMPDKEEDKKEEFKAVSINNFREKMLKEEKAMQADEPKDAEKKQQEGELHKGSGFFNKLRNTNDEEVKSKLKSNFRGLPI